MKKILFLAAVTILAAVSCNKIEEEGANTFEPSNVPSFVASVDGADTKTVIDGMKSYWNGTERIWVLNGMSGNSGWKKAYKATANKQATVTFKEEVASELSGENFLAVYPANPAGYVTWDGNIANTAKKFWLAADQIPTIGSYDPDTHIAVAYTTAGNNNLEFKNVTSLIKVNLTSDNVTEICFYGNNSDVIAGNFDVTYNNGQPTWSKGSNTLTYAKVKNTDGSALKKGVYYISVLPTTLTKGFSIETVSNGVKSIKKNSKPYTIGRNQIVDLGAIEWVAPSEELSRIIYLDVTKNWNVSNAKFAAHFWGGAGTNPSPVMMTKVSGTQHIYECKIDKDATDIIFVRKDPNSNTSNNLWDGEWNRVQTKLTADNNLFKITDWSAGTWSTR